MKKIANILKKYLESIGLILVLGSFGWQCWEEHSIKANYESHIIRINKQLNAIWGAEKLEAIDDKRYSKTGGFAMDYDVNDKDFKDWPSIKEETHDLDSQGNFAWNFRAILYVIGTLSVVASKIMGVRRHKAF